MIYTHMDRLNMQIDRVLPRQQFRQDMYEHRNGFGSMNQIQKEENPIWTPSYKRDEPLFKLPEIKYDLIK